MRSWWQLGEGRGQLGDNISYAFHEIECPFCGETDNYGIVFHKEMKKPNGDKKLNFDVLECGNCKGYVHAFWSADEYGGHQSLFDYHVFPYPIKTSKAPEYIPNNIARYWIQAQKALESESWDAAVQMTRSALQFVLREHNAVGTTLEEETIDLASKGILPPVMKDWAQEIRILGNKSAHPKSDNEIVEAKDANSISEFLDYMLIYLYKLPKQIKEHRQRKN